MLHPAPAARSSLPRQQHRASTLPERRVCTHSSSSSSMAAAAPQQQQQQQAAPPPLFSFGVVSDVQYADIPDGASFHGVPRFYRNALAGLGRAVDGWRAAGVEFGVHFGDILDGFQPKDKSEAALDDVLAVFGRLGSRTFHMLGNHCLYNLPRQRLNERLHIPAAPDGGSYYAFSPHPRWRLLVLDAYDVSLLGWPAGHPRHTQAQQLLDAHNPNTEKNSPDGLVGVARRFVKFGGGCSEAQLAWLDGQLQEAGAAGQRVIVCSHLPLFPDSCPPACLLWNYDAVLQLLQATGVVCATIAGHSHQNGYVYDTASGIHHVVLPAVVETPPGRDAYGVVEVHEHQLLLRGADTCMSCELRLAEAGGAAAAAAAAGQQCADSDAVVEVADAADAGQPAGKAPAAPQRVACAVAATGALSS